MPRLPPLLALLVLGGALAAPYQDAKNGFRVTPPAGWQRAEYPGTAVVYLAPQRVGDFNPNLNVIVQPLPAGVTQARYHAQSLEQIRTFVSGGKVVQARATTLSGQAANEVVYTGRQGKFSLYFIAIYAVRGRSAYLITGTTPLGKQGDMAAVTRAFARSFRITR